MNSVPSATKSPIDWQRASVQNFATFERLLNRRAQFANGTWWARVRPTFYRPLLPFEEFPPGSVKPPILYRLGGFQHVVTPDSCANSSLNVLMFQEANAYSLNTLDHNRKRQVRQAAKQFSIGLVTDREKFKQHAYAAYLSFYERTGYRFGLQRRNRRHFSKWADALFVLPEVTILGGYGDGQLRGVSVSLLVEDTLCYAMFFCDTDSLHCGLPDLMLHSVRESVAAGKYAKRIFAGVYHGGGGVDGFYLLRGCKIVRQPAYLYLNPLSAFFLKRFAPRQYARLLGQIRNVVREQSHGPLAQPAASRSPGYTGDVPDDIHEGAAASVVLLDRDGKVITSQTTAVGEKS